MLQFLERIADGGRLKFSCFLLSIALLLLMSTPAESACTDDALARIETDTLLMASKAVYRNLDICRKAHRSSDSFFNGRDLSDLNFSCIPSLATISAQPTSLAALLLSRVGQRARLPVEILLGNAVYLTQDHLHANCLARTS